MNNNKQEIFNLISRQKKNFPLDQPFYTDREIFKLDIETFFFNQWVFVGHESRIKENGEFFLFEIENESIIIVRNN